MDGVTRSPTLEAVLFSGGEPFSNPQALAYGLDICRAKNVRSIVGTSAYWAPSRADGRRFLSRFPKADTIWISTDIFHEEFVPLGHLKNALDVCRDLSIHVAFQIVDDDPEHSDFVSRFFAEVDPGREIESEMYFTPLGYEGRASEFLQVEGHAKNGLDAIPEVPCPWLGAPWIHEDGVACACPNLRVHSAVDHPLQLGNLHKVDFDVISREAQKSGYVQALRTLGPRGIVDNFPVESWGWDRKRFVGRNMCDLCHDLMATPDLAAKLHEAVTQSDWDRRIEFLRLLNYGEHAASGLANSHVQ
jgi:hypothetical protein